MPKYDFVCSVCGSYEEVVSRMSDYEDSIPLCCGLTMERQYSPPQLITDDKMQYDKGYARMLQEMQIGAMEHPETKEQYEVYDDVGGDGPYMAISRQRDKKKKLRGEEVEIPLGA